MKEESTEHSNRLVDIVIWSAKSWIVSAVIIEIVILLISLPYFLLKGGNLLALPVVVVGLFITAIRPSLIYGFIVMVFSLIAKLIWKGSEPSIPEALDRFRQ